MKYFYFKKVKTKQANNTGSGIQGKNQCFFKIGSMNVCVYKKEEDLIHTMVCILSLDDGNNCSDNGDNFPRS